MEAVVRSSENTNESWFAKRAGVAPAPCVTMPLATLRLDAQRRIVVPSTSSTVVGRRSSRRYR